MDPSAATSAAEPQEGSNGKRKRQPIVYTAPASSSQETMKPTRMVCNGLINHCQCTAQMFLAMIEHTAGKGPAQQALATWLQSAPEHAPNPRLWSVSCESAMPSSSG